MSLNSVNIMGNLTRDPELKYTPSGKAVSSLSIANNRVYTKNNERVTEVSYFDVEVWGVAADNCAKYLKKGSGIIVEGRLRQDRWEKDGKTQSRVRIIANSVHFMPKRGDESGAAAVAGSGASSSTPRSESESTISPEDIAWEE
ncbi:MAG: single-stranded DNA-binding protein [Candidatus Omnitrophica bacterium]|nr:single-stranded DNA-binding protein [Candidatus Omnitrophota bacterium]